LKSTKLRYNKIAIMRKIFTSVLVFLFAFLIISVTKVSGKIISDEIGTVIVAKTEVINDDLFVGAKSVEIDGTVNGDAYIGAETVRITGIINGNLHVGASTVNLGGVVTGNVYIGAGQVNVSSSKIGGSLLVGSGSLNVDKDSSVGGSILAGAGTLSVSSAVKRNIYVGAGTADINSTIGGEARIGAGSISIGSNTRIAKDLYYGTGNEKGEINISDNAVISGTIHKAEYSLAQRQNLERARKQVPAAFNSLKLIGTILSFFGALLVGKLYLKYFDKHAKTSSDLLTKSLWRSFGTGLLITIFAIPAIVVLLITMVGIPLAGLAFLLLLIFIYMTKIVVGMSLGDWLTQKLNLKKMTVYNTFALGLIAIYVLKLIPVVGAITGLVVLWSGLGALALNTFSKK
jgi:hypothetical protein